MEETMRKFFSITSTTLVLLGGLHAEALELPAFEKFGFPITRTQVSVLGTAGVEESSPIPTLTLGDMPASPHQVAVLAPRLTALILICSAAVTPDLGGCTHKNASAEMRLPAEFANPITCLMHAQAYLAETSLGQDLSSNDPVKIICVRTETAAASDDD
jgi:hypothetical protein